MKKISAILILAALAIAVAGCGSSSSSSSSSSSASTPAATTTAPAKKPAKSAGTKVTISSATVPGLGVILVNAEGRTLYTFAPDKKSTVTCTSSCASVWPPVTGEAPAGAKQVKASLLSSDANLGRQSRHVRRMAPVHLRRRLGPRDRDRTGPEPERRPLVRDHAGRQGDHEEAVEPHPPRRAAFDAANPTPSHYSLTFLSCGRAHDRRIAPAVASTPAGVTAPYTRRSAESRDPILDGFLHFLHQREVAPCEARRSVRRDQSGRGPRTAS